VKTAVLAGANWPRAGHTVLLRELRRIGRTMERKRRQRETISISNGTTHRKAPDAKRQRQWNVNENTNGSANKPPMERQ
jgi:hypothetical protein